MKQNLTSSRNINQSVLIPTYQKLYYKKGAPTITSTSATPNTTRSSTPSINPTTDPAPTTTTTLLSAGAMEIKQAPQAYI